MGILDDIRKVAPAAPKQSLSTAPVGNMAAFSNAASADDEVVVAGLMRTPMPHQEVVVQAVRAGNRSVLVGDEMGVGKTLSAIATIVDQQATPALVICPPSLVENWRREFAMAAPHLTVDRLSGTSADMNAVPTTDVVLCPDSIVAAWTFVPDPSGKKIKGKPALVPAGPLALMPWASLVIDECHRMKNTQAKRTRAAYHIGIRMRQDSIRLVMSGTPLINRPDELVGPLGIIGALNEHFGGKSRFLSRYVSFDSWGKAIGARNLSELNDRLRSTVMIRRLRSEVLTLPNKGRNVIYSPLDATNLRRYKEAVNNLVAFLRRERDDKDYFLNENAEVLVLLNTLKKVAGMGKVDAIIDHTADLVDEGEQVFVAVWHKDVADEIWKALRAKSITCRVVHGDVPASDRQSAIDSFQNGDTQVLVGTISTMGVGHTLTAARHVVIGELPWTPAELQQAEDRCHRIGQTREVISTVVLAGIPNDASIDDRLWSILDSKAKVVGEVLDNDASGIAVSSVANQLLDSFR